MGWWTSLFRRKPAVGMDAKPMTIEPSGNARETRRRARVERLRQVIAQGDSRAEVREELERLTRS